MNEYNDNDYDDTNEFIDDSNKYDITYNTMNYGFDLENNRDSYKEKKHVLKNKKIYKFIVLFVILFFLFAIILEKLELIKFPWKDYPIVMKLSQNELMMKNKTSFKLNSYVYPIDINFGKVIYESSDSTIASINSETGLIETKKNGIVTIKAYLEKYKKINDTCKLVISDNNVMVDKISIDNDNIALVKGNSYLLKYTYYPSNAGIHEFNYISSDTNVVKVNENGEVLAVGAGQAYITIQELTNKVSVNQMFTVYPNDENKKIISSIKSSINSSNLSIGGEQLVNININPKDAPQAISWISLDNNIAKVSNKGIITGISNGNTYIIATLVDGTNKIIDVNVSEEIVPIEKFYITDESFDIDIGESRRINTKIKPSKATNQKINWSSSDDKIATVDETGTILGISKGEVTITAITEDGEYTSKIIITVNEQKMVVNVTDFDISTSKVSVNVGESSSVKSIVLPENATNKKLIWKSANEKIATVNNGMIYGKSEGTTMISVTADKTNITKSILVIVNAVPLKSIKLNEENVEIGAESQVQLIVSYNPKNATYKSIKWSSSNPKIAVVNNKGLVTTLHKGSTIITAKASNGLTAKCKITVTNEIIHVTSIALSNDQYIVKTGETIGITPIISPSDATNQKVTIVSSNPNIVNVLDDGSIEGLREGVATITVTTVDRNKTAQAYVMVKDNNSSIQYLDGTTIKYWYDDSYKTYAITHIWVKDAYEQFKGEIPDKFNTLASPSYLTTKAAKKNPGKTLISINASSHVSTAFNTALYKVSRAYTNTAPGPVVIYEGKVLRDFSTTYDYPSAQMRTYGMDKDGLLRYYIAYGSKNENLDFTNSMINDGIRYTFTFLPVLVYNGKIGASRITNDTNIRQSICQIDANNFLYITNISSNRSIGFSTFSLANKMIDLGCITGFNLDGGGSTSIYYVKKGATTSTKIRVLEGTYGRSIPDIIYFVGE